MRCHLTLVAAFMGVIAAGPQGRTEPPVIRQDNRKAVTLPFELLDSGHMTIQVKLNGTGPYRVIFDTGAPGVIFSGRAAKGAELIPKDAKSFLLGSYTVQAKPATVQIGGLKSEGLVPQVMDHPTVGALATAVGPLDGLVGFDLFSPDKLTIDYKAKTLTVLMSQSPRPFDATASNKELEDRLFGPARTEHIAPAALWGLSVAKDDTDAAAGVNVTAVKEGGAAAAAGVKVGDRLLAVGRRWTDEVNDVYRAAAFAWAGKAVRVTVRRDGKDVDLTVRPRSGL